MIGEGPAAIDARVSVWKVGEDEVQLSGRGLVPAIDVRDQDLFLLLHELQIKSVFQQKYFLFTSVEVASEKNLRVRISAPKDFQRVRDDLFQLVLMPRLPVVG